MAKEIEDVTSLADVRGFDPARALEITVAEARAFFDMSEGSFDNSEAFENALDNMQGEVQQGNSAVAYVIIKIVK